MRHIPSTNSFIDLSFSFFSVKKQWNTLHNTILLQPNQSKLRRKIQALVLAVSCLRTTTSILVLRAMNKKKNNSQKLRVVVLLSSPHKKTEGRYSQTCAGSVFPSIRTDTRRHMWGSQIFQTRQCGRIQAYLAQAFQQNPFNLSRSFHNHIGQAFTKLRRLRLNQQ